MRTFAVRFQGEWLDCESPRDAATMQWAGDIISDLASRSVGLDDRIDLTLTLFRYGRYRAASELRWRLRLAASDQ
jgi:hypothetical protein